jgi:chromosomal replication initiator protein
MASAFPDIDPRATWDKVMERASNQLPETTVMMWFADVAPIRADAGTLTLAVPSALVRERLAHEHLDLIERGAAEATGRPVRVQLEVDEGLRDRSADSDPVSDLGSPSDEVATVDVSPMSSAPSNSQPPLPLEPLPFPNYTFDAFVPGPSNRFAHAAAMAVGEASPSSAYNPLFIYGEVGLGKTHLLIAVGHHMQRLQPELRVRYVTSDRFVTDFITSVRQRRTDAFRQRYRETDILLVDDIQFLVRKEETQNEFFHTFNHLHGSGRQIVIASDRPPMELSGLEQRLISRFRSGLCVDVQPPDLETRIAILQLKAERERIVAPPEVIELIASSFDQSVRELEGALIRVAAWSDLSREPIDLALTERAIEGLVPQNESDIPPLLIIEEVAKYFSFSTEDLVSPSRARPLVRARHIAAYLMRECTGLSLVDVGELLGGRDHTTILNSISKVEQWMRSRDNTLRELEDLTRIVRGRVRGAAS